MLLSIHNAILFFVKKYRKKTKRYKTQLQYYEIALHFIKFRFSNAAIIGVFLPKRPTRRN